MNWLQQIAWRCRELMALAQNASIAEQLQIWAEELELEGATRRAMGAGVARQGGATEGSTPAACAP